ncbi:50S ribosomal protein L2 [Candidatus Aerophobetes bacterium]|uniref:Large ribosomal subunit protein uL2 n=1 Tax=Aerophobetes bacterium TaxID=2030807 RepID=A0A2A4YMV7_UNCAE|nr:MAG: 50S ribosomal protein L2 [Candidatus Aerophobetes bacterium]
MVKKFRPVTPGLRKLVLPSNEQLTKVAGKRATVKPEKSLLMPKRRTNGRNHHGHITCRHRGGGAKRFLRIVDFKRDKDGIEANVASVEYDPNRTAHIALLHYVDGEKRYILAPEGIKKGDVLSSGDKSPFKPGCCMCLKAMPLGSVIHNIEMYPGRGGVFVRSAGLSAQLLARSNGYATLKMPSGEVRMVKDTCKATFGVLSNSENFLRVEGKAGRNRWKGFRPTVRGTAMNPVDHPHGGGEGRHNGYVPQTPWAKQTKGMRTRSKRKSNKLIVKDRRKK